MQSLSLRLSTIASLVPFGARVCDIGTDHGFLSIYLKQSDKTRNIIAADINLMPLENARKNIEQAGVSGIDLRLSDGLSAIQKEETDTVIIAGIGGEVISGIIERGAHICKDNNVTLILQPTTSPEFLRRFLVTNGYKIIREIPIEENGKVYSVMLVKYQGIMTEKDEIYYYIGEVPTDNPIGISYIKKRQKRFSDCAMQLEKVERKQEEYIYYKKLLEDINGILGEDNGI